jgi:hypothetical protein
LTEMHVAIIKRSVKDLGDKKYGNRFSAEQFFFTDSFEYFCKQNALPYESWLEKIKNIIKERGVRKKKLINNFLNEIRDYL